MKLYDYAFSNAPVRIRIVLYLKKVPFDRVEVDLLNGETANGRALCELNPQGMVPMLVDGDLIVNQSMAIAEYLNEVFPHPDLLPQDARERARVRSLAQMIACDGQPLVNLKVRRFLTGTLRFSRQEMLSWVQHWLASSLREYDAMLERDSIRGTYSHGHNPTLADAFLIPQVQLARRFQVELAPYTSVMRVYDQCMTISAFQEATSEYLLKEPEFGLDLLC